MTNLEENSSDRLDRIERLFEQNELRLERMIHRQESNDIKLERMILREESDNQRMISIERTVQAMLEQQATDRLKREEEKIEHQQRMRRLEDLMAALVSIEQGQNRMLANIDEAQPTMLRRLMSIENKVDTLIERDRET